MKILLIIPLMISFLGCNGDYSDTKISDVEFEQKLGSVINPDADKIAFINNEFDRISESTYYKVTILRFSDSELKELDKDIEIFSREEILKDFDDKILGIMQNIFSLQEQSEDLITYSDNIKNLLIKIMDTRSSILLLLNEEETVLEE